MSEAKEGDVVRIKSGGGPTMTVGTKFGSGHYCRWWDDQLGMFRSAIIDLSQLEIVEK